MASGILNSFELAGGIMTKLDSLSTNKYTVSIYHLMLQKICERKCINLKAD